MDDAPPTLHTLGYEGRTLEGSLGVLRLHGIRRLVDVRENPWSRKPGFSKARLAAAVTAAGVQSVHLQTLGCPRPLRARLRDGGALDGYLAGYACHLDTHADARTGLARLARDAPTAIFCVEEHVEDCHRQLIAARLGADGFQVIHL